MLAVGPAGGETGEERPKVRDGPGLGEKKKRRVGSMKETKSRTKTRLSLAPLCFPSVGTY